MPTQVSLSESLLGDFRVRLLALNRAPSTVASYVRTAKRFLRVYPDVAFDLLTPEHVEHWLYDLPISPRSQAVKLEELRAFFRFLVKQKRLLKTNPCDGAEPPTWKPRLRPAPSWEDFLALRRACATLEEAVLLEVFYFTGLRRNELRGLRERDLALPERRARVMGKGSKERFVVFPERVMSLFRMHLKGDPDAWVFPSPIPHYPRSVEWIGRTIARIGRQANLPYALTARTLRHGFARLLKTREVPLEVAAKLMGHSSIQTTAKIYGALDTDDLQKVYDRHIENT